MSIAIGRRDIDIRYDPLNGALVPEEILGADGVGNGEFHQNLAIDGLPGRFGFSPNEMPQRRTDIADSGIVVYEVDSSNNMTGFSSSGDPLVQVRPPIGGQPGVGEYAVDFNNPINYLNTGRFFFNPSDVNKYYRIQRYFGLGSLNSVRNTSFIEQSALALKLSRDGSLPMTGALDFGGFKGINVADGAVASDLINKGQFDAGVAGLNEPRGIGIYSVSGFTNLSDDKWIYVIDNTSAGSAGVNITTARTNGKYIVVHAISTGGGIIDVDWGGQQVIGVAAGSYKTSIAFATPDGSFRKIELVAP